MLKFDFYCSIFIYCFMHYNIIYFCEFKITLSQFLYFKPIRANWLFITISVCSSMNVCKLFSKTFGIRWWAKSLIVSQLLSLFNNTVSPLTMVFENFFVTSPCPLGLVTTIMVCTFSMAKEAFPLYTFPVLYSKAHSFLPLRSNDVKLKSISVWSLLTV